MTSPAVDETEELIEPAEVESQSQGFCREFCPVCFTDQVVVLSGGLIYCPQCCNTSDHGLAR